MTALLVILSVVGSLAFVPIGIFLCAAVITGDGRRLPWWMWVFGWPLLPAALFVLFLMWVMDACEKAIDS